MLRANAALQQVLGMRRFPTDDTIRNLFKCFGLRLRRAEAASALWIPHWHWEPFESQGTRAAKRYVNGNLVEREKGDEFGIKLLRPDRLWPVGSKK